MKDEPNDGLPDEIDQVTLAKAIDQAKGAPPDLVGRAGIAAAVVAGGVGGAVAAPAVAAACGATTILGSHLLATLMGGVCVATTPFGWVVGCALLGVAALGGLGVVVRQAGMLDGRRQAYVEDLSREGG